MTEKICTTCGGTILPPSIRGAKRGTCHCPENLTPDLVCQLHHVPVDENGVCRRCKAYLFTEAK